MKKLFALVSLLWCSVAAADASKYLLEPDLSPEASARVVAKLEVGGELLVPTEKEGVQKLPLKVVGNLVYDEQLVAWEADSQAVARSIRKYDMAVAKIEVKDRATERTLTDGRELMLAEIREGLSIITGGKGNLTRDQLDLVNMVGNTLAIDRLLPGREIAEGESWSHDAETLKALLCMDHVAVCEVSSVAMEVVNSLMEIRLAGTVHGTVDGTTTELELRAAYAFHLDHKRVTRFNLAIKEVRKNSEIVPGLDVVAKAFVTIEPQTKLFKVPSGLNELAKNTERPLSRTLVYEPATGGYRFEYDDAWYITAEERDRISFRYLHDHELSAHCNVSVLPARSAGRHTPLEEFEKDVRSSLGDKLKSVVAATEWETDRGYHCLGVIASGSVDNVGIEWRNYLISADDCPRLAMAVTLESDRAERFADAERPIIESIELVPTKPATASKPDAVSR